MNAVGTVKNCCVAVIVADLAKYHHRKDLLVVFTVMVPVTLHMQSVHVAMEAGHIPTMKIVNLVMEIDIVTMIAQNATKLKKSSAKNVPQPDLSAVPIATAS